MNSTSAEPCDGMDRSGIGGAVDGPRVKSLLRKPPLQILPELGGPDLGMCGEGLHSHVVFRLQRPQNQPRGLGAIALQAEQAGIVGGAEIVQPERIALVGRVAVKFQRRLVASVAAAESILIEIAKRRFCARITIALD